MTIGIKSQGGIVGLASDSIADAQALKHADVGIELAAED